MMKIKTKKELEDLEANIDEKVKKSGGQVEKVYILLKYLIILFQSKFILKKFLKSYQFLNCNFFNLNKIL